MLETALPHEHAQDADGRLCSRSEDTVNRWIEHFAAIEGGIRIDAQSQRQDWVENLSSLQQDSLVFPIENLPSLRELEFSLRQVKPGKASGPDGIPSEICRYFPGPIAKQLFTLMMKTAIQGHEPLVLKGGISVPIWKGKKTKDVCSAFRAILLSSIFGKAIHKTMRSKQALI